MSEHGIDPTFRGRHRAHLVRKHRGVDRLVVAGVLGLAGFILVLLGAAGPASGQVAAQDVAAPAAATQEISVKQSSLVDPTCDAEHPNEWHFVITQIDNESVAPAYIQVTWANRRTGQGGPDRFHRKDGALCDQPQSRQHGAGRDCHYLCRVGWRVQPEPWPVRHAEQLLGSTEQLVGSGNQLLSATEQLVGSGNQLLSAPSSSSAPETSSSAPPSSSSAPETSSSAPPSSSSAPETSASSSASSSSSAALVTSTSPFVPGPGQTGDNPPPGGFPMRPIMLGSGVGLLGFAAALASSVLRRRGSHT